MRAFFLPLPKSIPHEGGTFKSQLVKDPPSLSWERG
jgi:hypothetical protein